MTRRPAFPQRPKADVRIQALGVLARMFEGESLRFLFDRRLGPIWQLSPSGQRVADAVAAAVLANPDVVSAGDGLFADTPQTWRLAESA